MAQKAKKLPSPTRSGWFWYMVALAVGEMLAFTPLRFISLLVLLAVVASLLPLRTGSLTRLVAAFGLVTCVNSLVAVLFWIINRPLSSALLLSLLNAATCGLIYLAQRKQVRPSDWQITAADIASLVAALVAIGIVIWPVLQSPHGATLAQLVTAGGDNAEHLLIVKADDLNRGVAYGLLNRVNPPDNAINYPQGWHFNVAFTKWLLEPIVHFNGSPTKILLLFYLQACLWLGLLIYLIVQLGCRLGQWAGQHSPLASLGAAIVVLIVFGHWLVWLTTLGFQAQIAALVVLLLESLLLVEALHLNIAKRYPLLLLATLLAAGISYQWGLLLPIAVLPLLLVLGWQVYRQRRLPPLYFILAGLYLALFSLLQFFFVKIFHVTLEEPLLLQRGYIGQTSMYSLLFLAVLASGYAWLRLKNNAGRLLYSFLLAALLFSLGLFFYQLHQVHELRYFYFKANYTVIVFAAVFLAAMAYELLALIWRARPNPKWLSAGVFSICLLTLGLMVGWSTRSPFIDAYAQRTLAGIGLNQSGVLVDQAHARPLGGYFLTFMGSCDRGDDIRASQLANALAFTAYPQQPNEASFDPGNPDERGVFFAIKTMANNAPVPPTIVSNDQVLSNKLRDYLGSGAGKINLITLDTTPETEPIAQCPNRSRDVQTYPL